MSPKIATLVYALGIWALFFLDRDRRARTSKALWIPVVWLLIGGSRSLLLWLRAFGWNAGPVASQSEQYLEGSPFDRALCMVLMALGLIALVMRKRRVSRLLRANAPVVLFFLYCAISTLWSDFPAVAFIHWIKAAGDVVMVMVVLTEADRVAAVKRFLSRPAFLLIPISVLLIKYYPDLGREYQKWVWKPMYSGVTTTKNMLGMICLIFGLGSAWRFIGAWRDRAAMYRTRQMIAHGVILAMVMWLFWMANSMTSLSCFLLAGGLLGATSLQAFARKPALVHLLVAMVVAIPFSALFLNLGTGALETMGRDATLTGRTGIWKLVLSMTGNPLVGTGFESFWLGQRLDRVNDIMPGIQEAHNGYLEVFLELGAIGVMLLGIILVSGYRRVIAALPRDPELGPLRLSFFVVGVVYSFTEAGFRMISPTWIALLLAVLAVPEVANRSIGLPPPAREAAALSEASQCA